MSSRRKNPHPKRAVNARTVLKVKEEQPPVLCLKISDEDDDLEANHHQIQKEETKKNKRGRRSREAGLPEDSERAACRMKNRDRRAKASSTTNTSTSRQSCPQEDDETTERKE